MKTKLLRKLRKRFSWVWVPPTPPAPLSNEKPRPGYWLLFYAKLVIEFKSMNRHRADRGYAYNIDPTESAIRLMLDRIGLMYDTKRGKRLAEREKRSLIGKWALISIFKNATAFKK